MIVFNLRGLPAEQAGKQISIWKQSRSFKVEWKWLDEENLEKASKQCAMIEDQKSLM